MTQKLALILEISENKVVVKKKGGEVQIAN